MKRIISAILVLMLAMGLCACDKIGSVELPPLPTVTPEPTPTPEPTETPAAEPVGGRVIVSVSRTEQDAYDPQDGTQRILSFSYETPTVEITDNKEAEKAINEYIAMLNETYYTGEDYGDGQGTGYNNMLTMAEDNYNYWVNSGAEGAKLELASDRSVTVERADGGVITLFYNDYVDMGGAHGSYGNTAYCFDTRTGALLTLDTLSDDADALRAFLSEYLVRTYEEDTSIQERTDGFIPDGDYWTALTALLREGSWYFDHEGMVIFSDLYEISSYAAGPIRFTVPYDELAGHVDAKYIPEDFTCEGGFSVVSAADMTEGSIEIIDKLTVSADGQELYFIADGTVCEVSVSSVDYADTFYETAQLWYCSEMTDSALQLVTLIPEGMPNLMLRYYTAGGEHRLYLTESGENGRLILSDDNIEAVG